MLKAIRETNTSPPGPIHFDLPQSETTKEAPDSGSQIPLMANACFPEPDRTDLKILLKDLVPTALLLALNKTYKPLLNMHFNQANNVDCCSH